MKRSRIKGDKTGLKVVAYDFIADINNFYKGRDNTPCYIRKMNLENLIRNSKTKFVEYLNPIYYGTDKEVIQEKLREAIENNQEGLMLNLFDAPYECKRSKGLLKIKQFKDADVLVVDVVEGEGGMRAMTGALKCQFLYKDEVCDVEVGTGLKESERIEIFISAMKSYATTFNPVLSPFILERFIVSLYPSALSLNSPIANSSPSITPSSKFILLTSSTMSLSPSISCPCLLKHFTFPLSFKIKILLPSNF